MNYIFYFTSVFDLTNQLFSVVFRKLLAYLIKGRRNFQKPSTYHELNKHVPHLRVKENTRISPRIGWRNLTP